MDEHFNSELNFDHINAVDILESSSTHRT